MHLLCRCLLVRCWLEVCYLVNLPSLEMIQNQYASHSCYSSIPHVEIDMDIHELINTAVIASTFPNPRTTREQKCVCDSSYNTPEQLTFSTTRNRSILATLQCAYVSKIVCFHLKAQRYSRRLEITRQGMQPRSDHREPRTFSPHLNKRSYRGPQRTKWMEYHHTW